jgi:pyruvate/2-oxoglutarate/acetoin dehydrogenase E1 component
MVGIAPVADPNRPGGGTGPQHSQTLYPMFVHIPGLKVVAASNAYYAKGLTISAIRDDDPVIVLDHKMLFAQRASVPEEAYTWPIGKAAIAREGKDVTFVGFSYTTSLCQQAAEALAKEGIEAEVIDLLSLSPLDEEAILSSVRKTMRLVVVEESPPRCSVARDIAAMVADRGFDYLDAPIKTVTAPHTNIPYSSALEHLYPPTPQQIVDAVHEQMGKRTSDGTQAASHPTPAQTTPGGQEVQRLGERRQAAGA